MKPRPFKSVLVANRGEIAIRVFRACTELGLRTLGIYSQEDKTALHRYKADETYLVGRDRAPLDAYLDIEEIVALARRRGADAIHPGYGFLSENPELAGACETAGIVFIGPPATVLERMGDKVAARAMAESLGIPVIPGTPEPLPDEAAALAAAGRIGYPVILKASFGGGGRGMRVVRDEAELREQFAAATREAEAAFGRGEIFVEKYLVGPRHIEVQILADAHGEVVHLFERDCTVQRRHQKVLEIAPAPFLDAVLRARLCETAVTLARAAGYVNAGTVEFLLDRDRNYYFIEMNPRIQVEHTVTELITGVDLVKSQIRVAEGYRLADPEIGLPGQDAVRMRGYAIQARITTEDPARNFVPDYGRITHYRSPAGFGIRLDGGTAFTGALITPFYDSLLVKCSAWSLDFVETCRRLERALSEFRVHGVNTNIPFLLNVVTSPVFQAGEWTTTTIEETPELFHFAARRDRASRILEFVGEMTVNGNPTVPVRIADCGLRIAEGPVRTNPQSAIRNPQSSEPVVPPYDADAAPPAGTRQRLLELGPERFCGWVADQQRLLLTDTTFRDAHQSLFATRLRTYDMARVAPALARDAPGLFSLEMWGGATFDVAMRFLHEDPWERLAELREAVPNLLFQMLLRGANAVGYSYYPRNVVRRFVEESHAAGIDLFRIFDSLNDLRAMAPAIEAAREAGALAEAAICYTADLSDPARPRYHLPYYLELARELKALGAHLIGIKDMAGLLRPFAARELVGALKAETGLPVHLHTHDTAGGQLATLLFAAEAGVDIVDVAISSMAGLTSQPPLETLVVALERQPRDTGIDPDRLMPHADYWRAVREQYAPFETDLRAPAPDVYLHEIPGGQYSNLRPQAEALGVGDRLPELKRMYAVVNELLGDIVKVTPSSKVVGDLAIYMLTNGLTPQTLLERAPELQFPESVIGFFAGEIGVPPGGFPEALRRAVLKERAAELPADAGPREPSPVDFAAVRREVQTKAGKQPAGHALTDRDLLSYLMYPRVFIDYAAFQRKYTNVSTVPTGVFFYGLAPGDETEVEIEEGKTLFIKLVAVTAPDEQGYRTLFFELNGGPREVRIRDRAAGASVSRRPEADPSNLHHVGAPMPGTVQEVKVKPGDAVRKGEHLLSLEAMKVLTHVNSPLSATVKQVLAGPGDRVESGDLLVVFE